MSDFNRRDFIGGAVKGGLVFGTGFNSFADFARAQTTPEDEHFFIFVELRGGLQWLTATDGRDLDKLPLNDPNACLPLKITDTPLTPDEYDSIVNGDFRRRSALHGKFILLPFVIVAVGYALWRWFEEPARHRMRRMSVQHIPERPVSDEGVLAEDRDGLESTPSARPVVLDTSSGVQGQGA